MDHAMQHYAIDRLTGSGPSTNGLGMAFLEDARTAHEKGTNPAHQLLDIERHLNMCAVNLRSACEARFGQANLRVAPNQEAMWFISGARHLSAHAAETGGVANPQRIHLHWDGAPTGYAEVEVLLTVNVDEAEYPHQQARDAGRRFLEQHEGNFFLALHSACREVAAWVGLPLDEDFENLATGSSGRLTMRIPFQDRSHFEKIRDAIQNGEPVEFGAIDRIVAPPSTKRVEGKE